MSKISRFLATAAFAVAVVPTAAGAGGNIFLTGHDTDLHGYFGSVSAVAAMTADVNFVRNGSSLPLLVFDKGTNELAGLLTSLGIPYTAIDPTIASNVTDSLFDPTVYSAFAVASNVNCGGCDLFASDVANIATHTSAISAFFNAGGGILGFAAANDPNGYAYVPEAAANAGGNPPSNGFVETAAGLAAGLVAENGDATHNYFPTPGTGGLSSAYQVAEVNGDNVESVFIKNGSIVCTGDDCVITGGGGAVPEPGTWAMMLFGFGAIGVAVRTGRRRKALKTQRA
ncbi:hypothetical protein GCM10022276_09370 [Sphingomonas limnosediminicola]|uniref:Ice-binding protein C-terminal domain-containing protein n=1 Tax=Sphingomonas limnosediminicola TaxID=940133 RepID=A0ABP7L4M2_9SPHN